MYTKSAIAEYSYVKYTELRDSIGFKDADVSKATGIFPSTFTDWKKSKSMPGVEKLRRYQNFLGLR